MARGRRRRERTSQATADGPLILMTKTALAAAQHSKHACSITRDMQSERKRERESEKGARRAKGRRRERFLPTPFLIPLHSSRVRPLHFGSAEPQRRRRAAGAPHRVVAAIRIITADVISGKVGTSTSSVLLSSFVCVCVSLSLSLSFSRLFFSRSLCSPPLSRCVSPSLRRRRLSHASLVRLPLQPPHFPPSFAVRNVGSNAQHMRQLRQLRAAAH